MHVFMFWRFLKTYLKLVCNIKMLQGRQGRQDVAVLFVTCYIYFYSCNKVVWRCVCRIQKKQCFN